MCRLSSDSTLLACSRHAVSSPLPSNSPKPPAVEGSGSGSSLSCAHAACIRLVIQTEQLVLPAADPEMQPLPTFAGVAGLAGFSAVFVFLFWSCSELAKKVRGHFFFWMMLPFLFLQTSV